MPLGRPYLPLAPPHRTSRAACTPPGAWDSTSGSSFGGFRVNKPVLGYNEKYRLSIFLSIIFSFFLEMRELSYLPLLRPAVPACSTARSGRHKAALASVRAQKLAPRVQCRTARCNIASRPPTARRSAANCTGRSIACRELQSLLLR